MHVRMFKRSYFYPISSAANGLKLTFHLCIVSCEGPGRGELEVVGSHRVHDQAERDDHEEELEDVVHVL